MRGRLARTARLYAVAVAVNIGVAAASADGSAPGRPAVVRDVDGRRGRFDPREMTGSGSGIVLTVPLAGAKRPERRRGSDLN